MSRTRLRRISTIAVSAALLLTCSLPTASAKPDPGAGVSAYPWNCALMRIGSQLIRCDNLTGAGVSAPLWIPELLAASTLVPLKRGNL